MKGGKLKDKKRDTIRNLGTPLSILHLNQLYIIKTKSDHPIALFLEGKL
jgi:hypothetical protein